jgi:PRTRC genetic system protein C
MSSNAQFDYFDLEDQDPRSLPPPPAAGPGRRFIYDGAEFPDPDPDMSIEQVRDLYFAPKFPALTGAHWTIQPDPAGNQMITFVKVLGEKGAGRRS